MGKRTIKRLVLWFAFLLVLLISIGLLLPAQGRMGPVRTLSYASQLISWEQGVYRFMQDQGELPATFHLLLHTKYVSAYPIPYKRGFASRDHLAGTKEFSFGEHDCRAIECRDVSEEHIRATAELLGVENWAWEPVAGFWFSRMHRDWVEGSPQVVTSYGRFKDDKHGTLVYLGMAGGRVEYWGLKRQRAIGELEHAIQSNRQARERLNLAPMPPGFESFLLTGEPASVGDGTFVPPRLEQ